MANAKVTKRALAQSLKTLGEDKLLEKITIGDIVENCNLNRQTFYYHFNDKYELLDWIYKEEIFLPITENLTFENWQEKIFELLQYMKEEKNFIMNTLKSPSDFFGQFLNEVLVELFEKVTRESSLYQFLEDDEKNIYARFCAYGLSGVIVDWAISGMKEDVGDVTELLERVNHNMEEIGHKFYMRHMREN